MKMVQSGTVITMVIDYFPSMSNDNPDNNYNGYQMDVTKVLNLILKTDIEKEEQHNL